MLHRPGADPAVGLPEPDCVIVSSRGQDNRVAAHRALVDIHASPLVCHGYKQHQNPSVHLVTSDELGPNDRPTTSAQAFAKLTLLKKRRFKNIWMWENI